MVTNLRDFAVGAALGLTVFRVSPESTDVPSFISTWRYASGFIIKYSSTIIRIELYGFNIADTAISTYNGTTWSAWVIK